MCSKSWSLLCSAWSRARLPPRPSQLQLTLVQVVYTRQNAHKADCTHFRRNMLNVQFQHSIVQSSHIHTEHFLVRSNVTFNNVMLAQACRLAKAFEIVYGDDG